VQLWGAELIQRDNNLAGWDPANISAVTADTAVAPDGTQTADVLTVPTNMNPGNFYALVKQYSGLGVGTTWTFSLWVKLGTATDLGVVVHDGVTNGTIAGDKIFGAADGLNTSTWTQIHQTYTTDGTGTLRFHLGSPGSLDFNQQSSSGTVQLWGAELTQGDYYTGGSRSFTVSVTDAAGNTGSATSTLNVNAATPLLLDLNGDGIHTVGLSAGVVFDINANGTPHRTGWSDGKDGLLVLDLNGDGVINDGRELFGSGTRLPNGTQAANGYAALAQYDANHDGVIDANDAVFTNLKVWVDANTDGITEAGELKTLAELGIASFNLNALNATGNENGNSVILQSSWKDVNGVSHSLADWTFQADDRQVLVAPNGTGTLTGSNGGDVFRVAQGSTGTLTVAGFNASQNDALDLSALLKNANLSATSSDATLSKFVQLTQSGNDAVFKVDTSGSGNFAAPAETIVFTNGSVYGLNDTLNHLVANGHVILS
jgi:hypothetical protein